MNGKGSKPRPFNGKAYRDGYDAIFKKQEPANVGCFTEATWTVRTCTGCGRRFGPVLTNQMECLACLASEPKVIYAHIWDGHE